VGGIQIPETKHVIRNKDAREGGEGAREKEGREERHGR